MADDTPDWQKQRDLDYPPVPVVAQPTTGNITPPVVDPNDGPDPNDPMQKALMQRARDYPDEARAAAAALASASTPPPRLGGLAGGWAAGKAPADPTQPNPIGLVQSVKNALQAIPTNIDDARKALEPAPNTTYASVPWLPLAKDNTTGEMRMAMPSSIRSILQGGVDLMQGPGGMLMHPDGTMTLTPDATGTLAAVAGIRSPAAGSGKAIAGANTTGWRGTGSPVSPAPPITPAPTSPTLAPAVPDTKVWTEPQVPADPTKHEYSTMTPVQRETNLTDRANAKPDDNRTNGQDTTNYLGNDTQPVQPVLANTPDNTAKYAVVTKNDGKDLRANVQQQATDRANIANSIDTSSTTANQRQAVRDNAADADFQKAITPAAGQPPVSVSTQPVVDAIDKMLASGASKDPQMAATLNSVKARLYQGNDPTGALETDPQQIYALRKTIPDNATGPLAKVGSSIDDAMQAGIGDPYKDFRQSYANNSKPLNEITALRNAGMDDLKAKGTDMTSADVNGVIKKLTGDMNANGDSALSHGVSDDTWHKLFNLRDDLARQEQVLTPTGNVRAGVSNPDMENKLTNQLTSSKLKKTVMGAAYTANTLGAPVAGTLLGGGPLGTVIGAGVGAAGDYAMYKSLGGWTSRIKANQLQQWSKDMSPQDPAWGTPKPAPKPFRFDQLQKMPKTYNPDTQWDIQMGRDTRMGGRFVPYRPDEASFNKLTGKWTLPEDWDEDEEYDGIR